jgi:hypothetical protein
LVVVDVVVLLLVVQGVVSHCEGVREPLINMACLGLD